MEASGRHLIPVGREGSLVRVQEEESENQLLTKKFVSGFFVCISFEELGFFLKIKTFNKLDALFTYRVQQNNF